jgi:GPH family glycoside/pentoside/hexuronide:cation symporter
MSSPSLPPGPAAPVATSAAASAAEQDSPRRSIIYYAIGNIENGLANQFFSILSVVTVVALGMSPLLIGLIISLKTVLDAFTDPVMAHITDNARTKWGRRLPFILAGGVSRVLLVLALFAFFPRSETIKTNEQYQQEQAAKLEADRARAEAAAARLRADQSVSQAVAQRAEAEAGPAAAPAPAPEVVLPKPRPPRPSLWKQIKNGFGALTSAENPYHKHVFYYLLFFGMMFAVLSTVQAVPYYALGIEIAPSYDGRTKVVTYRSYADKAMGLVTPWVLPFCFLPMFTTVFDGLVWYGVAVCLIGIPTTVAMCRVVKEPGYSRINARKKGPPLLKSMWLTARNRHFLKILFLYVFIGFSNGIFAQLGTFLVLYWVFAGDMLTGSVVNGYAATLATVLGFASLPLIQWACRRFSKHAALRAAILWMSVGAALKWFLYNPNYPYLQLLLPFFFSVGIASVFTILPTLMADVTDVDELENGVRREGMFGAVMAFLMKSLNSLQPLLAAVVLTASGFDASLGVHQPDEVIFRMRLYASWVPAVLLLGAIFVLIRYPLTREKMAEIKATLVQRRAAAAAADGAAQAAGADPRVKA